MLTITVSSVGALTRMIRSLPKPSCSILTRNSFWHCAHNSYRIQFNDAIINNSSSAYTCYTAHINVIQLRIQQQQVPVSSCVIDVMDHGKVMDEQNYQSIFTIKQPRLLENIVEMIREKKTKSIFYLFFIILKKGGGTCVIVCAVHIWLIHA